MPAIRLALILNPRLTPIGLLQSINAEFGLPAKRRSLFGLVEELNQYLLAENLARQHPGPDHRRGPEPFPGVLEQIRLLSNLETERDKLIQIVLVGQPELAEMLARPNLRQLNQRIVVRCRLDPLDIEETAAYVLHRLQVAGRSDGALFVPAALREIHHQSAGYPRLINIIGDRALLVTYTEGAGQVSPRAVRQAAREIAGEELPGRHPSQRNGLIGSLLRLLRSVRRPLL